MIKSLIRICLLAAIFVASPVVMDHAKDVYLVEVAAKKAHPVKIEGRTVGSSWQVKYKGMRLTVTNNHVCSIMAKYEKAQIYRDLLKRVERAIEGKGLIYGLKLFVREKKRIDKIKFNVEGKSLVVGDMKRKILMNSPNHDICFLEPMGEKYFSMASGVHRGERVTIIGHPRGFDQSISDGRIVGERQEALPWLPEAGVVNFFTSTALSYPGNSGSPVVNRYGNVVGILFAGYPVDYVNINFVVPLSAIISELDSYHAKR